MIWTVPAIIGIILSLFFLYKLNKKKRKNLMKITLSAFLTFTILNNSLNIMRHVFGDTQNLFISKVIVSLGALGPILFFLTGYVALRREKINWTVLLHFLPVVIIATLVWTTDMIYPLGDPRFHYGISNTLFTVYTVVMAGYMLGTPAVYLLLYKKYKDHFGPKLIFFTLGTVAGLISYIVGSVMIGSVGETPLIFQTIPFTIAIGFLIYGYFR